MIVGCDEELVESASVTGVANEIIGRGVRWTPGEVLRLREMVREGATISAIAADLERKPTAVVAKATKLGISSGPGGAGDKRRKRWSGRDQEAFRRMAKEGGSAEAIAEALGRSVSSVRERLNAIRRYLG